MDTDTREQQIQQHLAAIRQLEADASGAGDAAARTWPPDGYYLLWHVLVGMMLGFIGAAVSLAFNAIGAPMADEHPLQLIRVYLTFPMGEAALTASNGQVLTVGCILYLVTGGLYGVGFHLVMSSMFTGASMGKRFIVGTALGLALWLINFYAILSWLQPMLLGGNWIVEMVPWPVAAATHVAFAWTMLLISFWARFDPSTHHVVRA